MSSAPCPWAPSLLRRSQPPPLCFTDNSPSHSSRQLQKTFPRVQNGKNDFFPTSFMSLKEKHGSFHYFKKARQGYVGFTDINHSGGLSSVKSQLIVYCKLQLKVTKYSSYVVFADKKGLTGRTGLELFSVFFLLDMWMVLIAEQHIVVGRACLTWSTFHGLKRETCMHHMLV